LRGAIRIYRRALRGTLSRVRRIPLAAECSAYGGRNHGEWLRGSRYTGGESLDMQDNTRLVNYVVEQLAFLGRISSRAIFGGVGVFIDERLLAIIINDAVYLHTGEGNVNDYLSRGMPQFKPYPNAFDLTTDHHRAPVEVVEDPVQLKVWGERALAAAIEAAKAKKLAGITRSRHMKQAKKKY
jgi:DNA transformation protein